MTNSGSLCVRCCRRRTAAAAAQNQQQPCDEGSNCAKALREVVLPLLNVTERSVGLPRVRKLPGRGHSGSLHW